MSRIASQDPEAIEDLYAYLNRVVRPYIRFKLPEHEPDDILHEALTVVVEAIQGGALRNPEFLHGYVQAIVRRLVAGRIVSAIWKRKHTVDSESALANTPSADNPESRTLDRERGDDDPGPAPHALPRFRIADSILSSGRDISGNLPGNGINGDAVPDLQEPRESKTRGLDCGAEIHRSGGVNQRGHRYAGA